MGSITDRLLGSVLGLGGSIGGNLIAIGSTDDAASVGKIFGPIVGSLMPDVPTIPSLTP